MTRSATPLAALFLAGCAATPTAPPPVVDAPKALPTGSSTPSTIVDVAPPPPPPKAAVEPPPIDLPASLACSLEGPQWHGAHDVTELRFRSGGPVFARIGHGKGRLLVPPGSAAQGAGLELADESLVVHGYIAGDEVWLNAARPFVMGEALIPAGRSRLTWVAGQTGTLTVSFTPAEGVTLAQAPLLADVACSALGVNRTSFSSLTSIPGFAPGKTALLRVDRVIPISISPAAAAVASLTAKRGDDVTVTVMDTVGSSSRIAWDRPDALVFGWVKASDLHVPTTLPALSTHGTGSGADFARSIHPISTVVCKDDVPLMAEAGGERFTVGRILAGATIHRMDAGLEETEVVVASGAISFPPAVKVRVRTERLVGCPVKAR